jgi:hypothetical protein
MTNLQLLKKRAEDHATNDFWLGFCMESDAKKGSAYDVYYRNKFEALKSYKNTFRTDFYNVFRMLPAGMISKYDFARFVWGVYDPRDTVEMFAFNIYDHVNTFDVETWERVAYSLKYAGVPFCPYQPGKIYIDVVDPKTPLRFTGKIREVCNGMDSWDQYQFLEVQTEENKNWTPKNSYIWRNELVLIS